MSFAREQELFLNDDELTDRDIICGTGPLAFNHVGTTMDDRKSCAFFLSFFLVTD
jgi:hypothetical protein